MFPQETYVTRRAELASKFESGLLLFPGNSESPMNYADNCYTFRQDSTFLYYFGLDQPDLAATIDVETGNATIYGNELTIDDIVWMGDLPTIAARAERVGISDSRPMAALRDMVNEAKDAGRPIRFLPPYRAEATLFLSELLDIVPSQIGPQSSEEFIWGVANQRIYKSDEEIAEIEKAVATSVEMHTTAMRMVKPGMVEAEVAGEMERIAIAAGGKIAFPVIATINGQTLHNHYHGNTMSEGDLFLLDIGAETAMGYGGDLSSTCPVSPRFTDRQKTIYELQVAAQEAAVDKLAPGIPNRDAHFAAARVIFEGLKGLGIFKGDTEEALTAGAHAMVFPCGTGHMMGLDIHDMENLGEVIVGYDGKPKSTQFGLKSLRLARELKPGFAITVEPGIYFIPQLMDLWKSQNLHTEFINYDELNKWRDFGGVRNEEDYLITEDGARRLGPHKPLTVSEVEELRN